MIDFERWGEVNGLQTDFLPEKVMLRRQLGTGSRLPWGTIIALIGPGEREIQLGDRPMFKLQGWWVLMRPDYESIAFLRAQAAIRRRERERLRAARLAGRGGLPPA